MTEQEFKSRTKRLALQVIRLVEQLPRTRTADVLGKQLLRSGTSVGANYRAACRGLSTADVLSKLGDVEEEADESLYWMELLVDSGSMPQSRVVGEMKEMDEVLRMTVASIKTLRQRLRQSKIQNPQSKMVTVQPLVTSPVRDLQRIAHHLGGGDVAACEPSPARDERSLDNGPATQDT
jgi:four helix bundle protein